jgi:hypothetical protein
MARRNYALGAVRSNTPACTPFLSTLISVPRYVPLNWLRYIGLAIIGNASYISTTVGGPEVDDYQAAIRPGVYHKASHILPSQNLSFAL